MTADEFLDKLEQQALVPGDVVASLRQQVAKSLRIVPPESLAKLLVDKKRLTHDQAQQLISGRGPKVEDEELLLAPLDNELRLAPLDDGSKPKATSAAPAKTAPAGGAATAGQGSSVTRTAAKPNTGAPAAKAAVAPVAKGGSGPAAAKPASTAKTAAQAAATAAAANAAFKSPTGKQAPAAKPAGAAATKSNSAGAANDPFGLGAAPSMDDLLPEPQLGEAAAMQGNPLQLATRRRQGVPSWVWIASGVGAVVVIGAIVAISILTRSNGDAEWKLAEKDYLGGADQEALYKLEAFVERFPRHPQVSQARVYQEMSKLRQVYAAKGDWEHPLTTAEEVLPQMVKEPAFPSVRDEVGKMLPEIAAGLTKQAEAGEKASLEQRRRQVELAQQALVLAQDWRFVPASVAPWAMLHATADRVARLAHDEARDAAFEQATAAITAASGGGKPADAIALRDTLLDDFPELRQDSRVLQINQDLAEASLKLVKPDATTKPPETKPRATPVVGTVLVVPTRAVANKEAVAPKDGEQALPLLIDGMVYWLKFDTGAPVGRRFVGFDSVPPVAVDTKAGADTILFDAAHQELLRCDSTGKMSWRLPLGERVAAAPVVLSRNGLVVATASGKLLLVDVESGQVARAVQLPGHVRAPPALSPNGTALFVATDEGTLLVLAGQGLKRPASDRFRARHGERDAAAADDGGACAAVRQRRLEQHHLAGVCLRCARGQGSGGQRRGGRSKRSESGSPSEGRQTDAPAAANDLAGRAGYRAARDRRNANRANGFCGDRPGRADGIQIDWLSGCRPARCDGDHRRNRNPCGTVRSGSEKSCLAGRRWRHLLSRRRIGGRV